VSLALYIDSSFLLAILLEEEDSHKYAREWKMKRSRVASILLEAECIVTLRRVHRNLSKSLSPAWLEEREKQLFELLDEVSLRTVDRTITKSLRNQMDLSDCRSLDALHIATALELQENSGEPIIICTLDRAMRKLSEKLGFTLLPETSEEAI